MLNDKHNIPVGLGTKVGLLTASVGALVAALAAILHGDHSETTITGLIVAAITVYGVVRSRGEQAAALYRDAPSQSQTDDGSDEPDDVDEIVSIVPDEPSEPLPTIDFDPKGDAPDMEATVPFGLDPTRRSQ